MLKLVCNKIRGLKFIYIFLFSVTLSHAANNWKYLNHEISHKKMDSQNTHEKNFEPSKYPRRKILDPRITCGKKFWTTKIPTRKSFGPTKAQWHDGTWPTKFSILSYFWFCLCIVSPENGKSKKVFLRFWIIIEHLVMKKKSLFDHAA